MSVRKGAFLAFVLFGLGWAVGYAQRSEPEFMIAIDAPVGETRVECVSGCELMGARDLGNPNAGRLKVYTYGCSGRNVRRCRARIAGWLVRSNRLSSQTTFENRRFETGRNRTR
jgi:hypothetical protein